VSVRSALWILVVLSAVSALAAGSFQWRAPIFGGAHLNQSSMERISCPAIPIPPAQPLSLTSAIKAPAMHVSVSELEFGGVGGIIGAERWRHETAIKHVPFFLGIFGSGYVAYPLWRGQVLLPTR
jgi:hypothetical protein